MRMHTDVSVGTEESDLLEAKKNLGARIMDVPLEYRRAGVSQGNSGLIISVSDNTLVVYSRDSMPVGFRFKLTVFSAAYRFTQFEVVAKVVSKREDIKDVFGGYVYGLDILDFMTTRRTQIAEDQSSS